MDLTLAVQSLVGVVLAACAIHVASDLNPSLTLWQGFKEWLGFIDQEDEGDD